MQNRFSEYLFRAAGGPQNSLPSGSARPTPAWQSYRIAPPGTLEQAVAEQVEGIADGALTPLAPDEAPPFAISRALLALLIRCYARQIYKSSEVSASAWVDEDFPRLPGETVPDTRAVRRFRSDNRKLLQRGLGEALKFTEQKTILLGVWTEGSDAQLAGETSRRIIMAMFLDSMELEGE